MKLFFAVLCLGLSSCSSNRIIGGEETTALVLPYQVHITNGGKPCSGSLISTNYVLTAASCVIGAAVTAIEVQLGADDLANTGDVEFATVENVNAHPGFVNRPEAYQNDIALLKLEEPVTLTKRIQLVAMPTFKEQQEDFLDSVAVVAAWGQTDTGSPADVLQKLDVKIISNSVCTQYYGKTIHPTHVCTDGKVDDPIDPPPVDPVRNRAFVGTCTGDSGAPLVIKRKQIGVASFEGKGCMKGDPSVFTRVSQFLDWIQANSDAKIQLN